MTNAIEKNPGTRYQGTAPGVYWEMNFTEVKPEKFRYKYLLMFIDAFSVWTEDFLSKHKTTSTVTKKLLEDILTRYGLPQMIGSDNEPAFVSHVSQGLANILDID